MKKLSVSIAATVAAAAALIAVLWLWDKNEPPQIATTDADFVSPAAAPDSSKAPSVEASSREMVNAPSGPPFQEPLTLTGVVRSDDGMPLEGATVRCALLDPPNEVLTVVSGAAGEFRFELSRAVPCECSALKDGFVIGRRTPVTVGSAIELVLRRGSIVSGTVVNDDDDTPISGATVRLDWNAQETTTDSLGNFRTTAPVVCVDPWISAPGFVSWSGKALEFSSPATSLLVRLVSDGSSEECFVDARDESNVPVQDLRSPSSLRYVSGSVWAIPVQRVGARPATLTVGAPNREFRRISVATGEGKTPNSPVVVVLASQCELSVLVVDRAGIPVNSARVAIADADASSGAAVSSNGQVITGRTGPDGRTVITGLGQRRDYRLTVTARDLAQRLIDWSSPESTTSELNVQLTPMRIIQVRPRDVKTGKPIAGAVARISTASGEQAARTTNSDGVASLPYGALPATITFESQHYATEVVTCQEQPDAVLDVDLNPGATLRGRLIRSDGLVASLAVVYVTPARPASEAAGTVATRSRSVQAASDGTYELSGLPAGEARVIAREGAFASDEKSVLITEAGTGLDLILNPFTAVTFEVTSRDTRRPVSAYRIEVLGPEGERIFGQNVRSSAGACLADKLRAGVTYSVRITADGYEDMLKDGVTSIQGAVKTEEVALNPESN